MKKIIIGLIAIIFTVNGICQQKTDKTVIIKVEKKAENVKDTISENIVIEFYRKLEKEAIKNNVVKPKLKLGLEILRTDKMEKEIWLKKSEYPLGLLKTTLFDPKNFKLSIYSGKITIPIQIYSPYKKTLAEKSSKMEKMKLNYTVELIPIKKEGDVYTFHSSIGFEYRDFYPETFCGKPYKVSTGGWGFLGSKEIKMKIGEKIKLETSKYNNFSWTVSDMIDGKKITFDSQKDYFDYFNDYIILYLESDK